MQRKRTTGYYSDRVDFGSSILPVRQMRKFTMNKLLKLFVFIVIGYVFYSVYEKHNLAKKASENQEATHNGDFWDKVDTNEHADKDAYNGNLEANDEDNRRVKEEINKVFEEFKRKQEDKEVMRKSPFDVKADQFVNDNVNLAADEADNKMFGEDNQIGAENDQVNKNPEFFFEPVDEEQENEELEIEKEIEQQIADLFKDAVNEVADEQAEVDENAAAVNWGINANVADGVIGNEEVPDVQQVIEKKEFNAVVKQIGKEMNPPDLKHVQELAARRHAKKDDDHELPPFVTAVRQTTIKQVTQLIASIQQYVPGSQIYVFDLDLEKEQKKELMSMCGVRLRLFMKGLFPSYFSNLDNLHWKPIVMQTALAEFGHITWVNPQFRLGTPELATLIHDSHEVGIVLIGQRAGYTTFAATHPDMSKFIPSNKEKLASTPHIEIRAVMLHNSPEVHENIMKVFTACAMEESCLSPKGARKQCHFDFTGRAYGDCHRYDESALNILVKNWFDYDMTKFAKTNAYFKTYDPSFRPKLNFCRDLKDIRDSEL